MTLKVNIHIFGLTKYTNYTVKNVPVFVPVLLYAVTMLIFHIKRIISSEKWFNYVVTFFFLKMPKIWVGRMTLNGEKKEDGLNDYVSILTNNGIWNNTLLSS